ncbi:MAG: glycosyltransferase [Patescibacteria group bacterium]
MRYTNIFFIPSWYPSKFKPAAGYFIKEQAIALGKYCPSCRLAISLWGDQDTKISFEKPKEVFPHWLNFLLAKPYQKKLSLNVWEICQPALEWSPRIFKGNIKAIIRVNRQNFFQAQKKIGKINLIHAHISFPAGYVAMKLAQDYQIPYIITEHYGPFPQAPFDQTKYFNLIKEPLKNANNIIVVSPVLKKTISKLNVKKIAVIGNQVDEDFFVLRKNPKTEFFRYFTAADITPTKGIADLIEAIRIVVNHNRQLEFRIAGEGKFLGYYQKITYDLQKNGHLKWLGFLSRDELRRQLQNSQVFISPSHHESFGLAIVEALFCGRPVIATRSGGPESYLNTRNSILIDIGNIKQLARAILSIKNHYQDYHSSLIRKEAVTKFSSKIVAKQVLSLYYQTIKGSLKREN